ncbi:glycine-rich protein 2-like [Magnolia sinica]|uniref:glycine-rich protein 2-like n=1 Tax=Magnolia sinica TaxID=86752 RepID=UPI002659130E|nr:glycine-rich protein 2-like [Magnolia sinica]
MARFLDGLAGGDGSDGVFHISGVLLLLCMVVVSLSIIFMIIFACGDDPDYRRKGCSESFGGGGSGYNGRGGDCGGGPRKGYSDVFGGGVSGYSGGGGDYGGRGGGPQKGCSDFYGGGGSGYSGGGSDCGGGGGSYNCSGHHDHHHHHHHHHHSGGGGGCGGRGGWGC